MEAFVKLDIDWRATEGFNEVNKCFDFRPQRGICKWIFRPDQELELTADDQPNLDGAERLVKGFLETTIPDAGCHADHCQDPYQRDDDTVHILGIAEIVPQKNGSQG